MSRDTKVKNNKMESNKRTKKTEELSRRKKSNSHSDSDDNNSNDSDYEEMDTHEYRKFLSKIFPSKHLNNKIKAGNKLKKTIEEDLDESEEDESEDEKIFKKKSKVVKKSKKVIEESESEETIGTEDSDEEDEEDEESEEEPIKKQSKNFNIIFTIGGTGEEEYDEDEEDWETDDEDYETEDDETEDEDEEVSSDSSSEDEEPRKKKISEKEKREIIKQKEKEDKNEAKKDTTDDSKQDELLLQLKEIYEKNKDNKTVKKCLEVCEEDIKKNKKARDKKQKKQKDKNSRIFKKIVKDKNTMNDFSFFQKIEIDDQKKIIKELKEINKLTRVEKPYRMTLLEANMPIIFKAAAMKKINSLRYMEPGSGEFYKIKNWVDTFMRMPFGNYLTLPINISDGVDKCHEFMETAQKTLDEAVYGLNDAKMQIMQMLGQLITNPKAIGTSVAIHGPPGTGKTSLVKEGISKILNRPFAFIALGGATDSSFLEGHSYTYEGSTWGKIVQILIDSKCMNPVIYFDELDKISDTPKGEEIAGILTHLTDTSQNSQFHDKYFAEVDFDLSKCLFIFSYNDESKINPILRDRMYRIQTKGYNQKQKTIISNNYLLPKIREQVKFENSEIVIPDAAIHYIIENLCNKEDGVRNLKRCLEIIHTKLNLYRLMKPGSNLFEEDMALKVEFPFTVTKEIVDKLIKKEKESISLYGLYV
jgi:ATP-dependent Lon protease